jgi:tripartite motif-containing protein 71
LPEAGKRLALALTFAVLAMLALAPSAMAVPQYVAQWGGGERQMNLPAGVATDASGNVYLSDTENDRIQKFTSTGAFTQDWGGTGGGSGRLDAPRGIAVDSSGNVYVADQLNNRIEKFGSGGNFLAAWGTSGTGDGQFSFPQGVAVDSSSNVYVADTENDRIQKFTSTGTFLAKWGTTGAGDGQFDFPVGIAVDSSNNVYVADSFNDRVQKFNSSGTFLTKWGTLGTGDGQFDFPTTLATDGSNNVYVTDSNNDRVQKFNSTGSFLTKWGTAGIGDGQFENPSGIATHSSGSVYVTDTHNSRVQKFSLSGTFTTKWGTFGTGDTQFEKPNGAAVGPGNVIYVADTPNHRIQKFSSVGSFLTKWGSGGSTDGAFSSPGDVATDASGNVYVADTNNHRVQKFNSSGTFLTKWGTSGTGDGQFNAPTAIAVNGSGNVYVADTGNNRIQWFNSTGTFLGKTSSGSAGAFNAPRGIEFDSSNNIYVADSGNNRIQKLDSAALPLTAWGSAGSGNGQFQSPWGVDVDSANRVYVADQNNNRVQRFTSTGGFVDSFGTSGAGDGQLAAPHGLAIDSLDGTYVADTNNNRIQKFSDNAGQIVVVKDASPNDAQNFDFTTNADPGHPTFTLDDDSDPALSNTKTLTVAPTSGYTVSETVPTGWTQSSATCSDGSPVTNINVSAGETVTCTFVNARQAKIVVVEDSIPDAPQDFVFSAGGGLTPTSFTLDDDSDATLSNTHTFNNVTPGSGYSISEAVPANWTLSSATCSDGSPVTNINVSASETVTCTFTNRSGKIVVVKNSRPDDPQDFTFTTGGGLSPSSFILDDDTDSTRSNTQSIYNVAPGSGYSVTETMPTGWEEAGATCDDGSPISNINVSLGETVTCTFINDKQGKIVVAKNAVPDNAQDFQFTAGGGLVPTTFTLDDDSDPTLLNIKTYSNVPVGGGYSISESVPSGWTQTSATCSDGSPLSNINVSFGETVTCTFTNTRQASIVVKKDVQPGTDPQDFSFTAGGGLSPTSFQLDDDPSDATLSDTRTFSNVAPGSGYSVSESPIAGWGSSPTCDDGSPPSNISVSTGEVVTCTFINVRNDPNYERPSGATPIRVPLVPAFKACSSPNSTHGAPLNFPSCSPPDPASGTVMSGTGAVGYAFIIVCSSTTTAAACNEGPGGFESSMRPDVRLFGEGRDIQCRAGVPTGCSPGADYNPNGATGPYTTVCGNAASCGSGTQKASPFCAPGAGSSATCIAGTDVTATTALGQPSGVTVDPTAQCGSDPTCLVFVSDFVGHAIRVTDQYNCDPNAQPTDPNACPASASTSTRPATMVDILFPVPADCIANPAGGAVGSNCGVNTTANALVPGSVIGGKNAVVELGEVQILDSGPDGTRGNSDDERFAVQGIFVP